jgi:hypothetical protein
MAERSKAAVLKTAVGSRPPGVRIPLPPPGRTTAASISYIDKKEWGGAREADWGRLLSDCRGKNLDRGFESRPPR